MLILHQTKISLGCEVTLVLTVKDNTDSSSLFNNLWLYIFQFEKRFSRFLPASELSRFNATAGTKQFISDEFEDILTKAKSIGLSTDGLYNPFVLPALQRVGYKHSMVAAHQHDEVDDYQERSLSSVENLEIGKNWCRIPYGTAIDLGGCGKGYLADRLSELVASLPDVHGYWFSLGGDIIAGGLDVNGEPWDISVEAVDSSAKHSSAGSVENHDGKVKAVATSAVTARKGTHNGKPWHHIIDPTTGMPSKTKILAATILAESAFTADVLATCLIIAGESAAPSFMNRYTIDGILLQTVNNHYISFGAIHVANKQHHTAGASR